MVSRFPGLCIFDREKTCSEAQLLAAFAANVFTLKSFDFTGITAENAGRFVLFQDDHPVLGIDFKGVTFGNVESAAQFDGQYDTT